MGSEMCIRDSCWLSSAGLAHGLSSPGLALLAWLFWLSSKVHRINDTGASPNVNTTGNPNSSPATLLDIMLDYVDKSAADPALACWDSGSRSFVGVAYSKLVKQAFGFGQRLIDQGQQPQSICMIACHSPYSTLVAFYGAISAGVIPMIFPMPKALGSHDALTQRIQHWSTRFQLPAALVLEEGLDLSLIHI